MQESKNSAFQFPSLKSKFHLTFPDTITLSEQHNGEKIQESNAPAIRRSERLDIHSFIEKDDLSLSNRLEFPHAL